MKNIIVKVACAHFVSKCIYLLSKKAKKGSKKVNNVNSPISRSTFCIYYIGVDRYGYTPTQPTLCSKLIKKYTYLNK